MREKEGEADYGEEIGENTNSNKNKLDSGYWK
jgi:hypothetical protein